MQAQARGLPTWAWVAIVVVAARLRGAAPTDKNSIAPTSGTGT